MNELPRDQQKRVIGSLGGIAVVAGSMLGIGVFLAPRVVAEQVQSPALFMALWVFGGLVAFSGAVAYAELGTMFPRAGGDYVYLREAFGPSVAFASGWLLLLGVFTGSIATMAVPVCQYQISALVNEFVAVDFARVLLSVDRLHMQLELYDLCAIGLVLLITGLNVVGVKLSVRIQTLATLIPIVVLLGLAGWALTSMPHETAAAATRPDIFSGSAPGALMTAFLAIYFAYAGWNAIAYVGGEVENPSRTIPISIVGGTVLITAVYAILAAMFLAVLGMGGLTTAFEAGTATAAAMANHQVVLGVTTIIAIALLGSLNGTVLGGGRVAYAMAVGGALPQGLGRLRPSTGVPGRALWLQAVIACLLIATGTFEQLLELTSLGMMALGSLNIAALFVLRRRRPDLERPYSVTGYPLVPLLYLAVSMAVVIVSFNTAVNPAEGAEIDLYPLFGVGVFVAVLIGHRVLTRPSKRQQ